MGTIMDVNKLIGKSYLFLKTILGDEVNIPGEFADYVPSMAKMEKDGKNGEDGEDGEDGENENSGENPWIPPGDQPLGDVVLIGPKGDIASIIWEDSVYTDDGKEIKTRKSSDDVKETNTDIANADTNADTPQEDNI